MSFHILMWHSYTFVSKVSVQIFFPLLYWVDSLLLSYNVLSIFWLYWKYFLTGQGLPFHFRNSVFWKAKDFHFYGVQLTHFSFIWPLILMALLIAYLSYHRISSIREDYMFLLLTISCTSHVRHSTPAHEALKDVYSINYN